MKRKEPPSDAKPSKPKKKPRPEVPDYHLTPSIKDDAGEIIWPAPKDQMEAARAFIVECANAHKPTLLVPDKDADGLTSGAIMHRTLTLLGLPSALISTHLLHKGSTIHTPSERAAMAAKDPAYIIVLDQGSRKSPPVIDDPDCKALVIDHHFADPRPGGDFPAGAVFVNACHCPPVATSSLLTYILCCALHAEVGSQCDWLAVMGTHGDLGNTLKWAPPFPDMSSTFKKFSKKTLNDAVSLLNAPRRTAAFDVVSAWNALMAAKTPGEILGDMRLREARREVNEEVERCTHTPPKFSRDGRVAVLRIESKAQVHPVIATRWAGHLSSRTLEIILVANTGYAPNTVHFSCRIPRSARSRDPPVNIIASLKAIAAAAPSGTLVERLGEDFAKGHVQASGGIVGLPEFEELMEVLGVGEKREKEGEGMDGEGGGKEKGAVGAGKGRMGTKGEGGKQQKNTLMNYFGKGAV